MLLALNTLGFRGLQSLPCSLLSRKKLQEEKETILTTEQKLFLSQVPRVGYCNLALIFNPKTEMEQCI